MAYRIYRTENTEFYDKLVGKSQQEMPSTVPWGVIEGQKGEFIAMISKRLDRRTGKYIGAEVSIQGSTTSIVNTISLLEKKMGVKFEQHG